MNENMSMTAEVSAFVRAYHTAEGGEICNDPLAVKLLGEGRFGQIAAQMTAGREWFLPGDTGTQEEALRRIVNQKLGPAVLARAAWWEQELRRELTMGLKQVLLLGAGLESLPCRQTAEMERMSFYEVDTPAVLAEKEKRLREVGITTPRNVYRVGVDLAEDWEKTLPELALMLERHGFLIYEDMGPREITERFYAGYNEGHPESPVLPLPETALVLAAQH
jgi:methyltransferase (TIGR00027 family)